MSHYDARQRDKRERLEKAVEKAKSNSQAAGKAAHSIVENIPLGQPILVGHHSEKRHRRAIDRMGKLMSKSVEEDKRAKDLAYRAASVGTGGVASDDPEAVAKLKTELAKLEEQIEHMKDVNAAYRKGGLEALDPVEADAFRRLKSLASYEKQPYPAYALSNANANARRIEKRIEQLQKMNSSALLEYEGWDWKIVEDRDEGRFILTTDERLSTERYQIVRGHGFVWARSKNAFVRKLSPNAAVRARQLADAMQESATPPPWSDAVKDVVVKTAEARGRRGVPGCTPCALKVFDAPAMYHSCGKAAE